MASTCLICNGELRKLLVTQKKPWRVLFQDELSIYRKEEVLKKSYLDCDGFGGERPEFNMMDHFAFLYRTCEKHVMQADGTFVV